MTSCVRALLAIILLAVPPVLAASAPEAQKAEPAQSIQWNEWKPESFALAVKENKPILLFIATGWTKASAYIDEVILTDPEVVQLVKERWIPIRVERDRRPDVEFRYRLAVSTVIGEHVGFPLIAMLSKEGEVLYGKSFIPLDDRRDGPGLRSFLKVGAERYASKPGSGAGYRVFIQEALARESRPERPREIAPALIDEIAQGLVSRLDPEFGGFGTPPKVPNPFAVEFAATIYQRHNDPAALAAVTRTLDGMEAGAIYDRIAGGFHRIVNDAAWRRPIFEKMLNYNGTLLSAYVTGWQATGNDDYRTVASRLIDWILATLSDPGGGFHAAQMSMAGPATGKDLYYTWSKEEFDATVPSRWLTLAHNLYNITAEGDLVLGDPPRSLLFMKMSRAEAASTAGIDGKALRQAEAEILSALGTARAKRGALPVDEAIYVDSTAIAASALFQAGAVLDRDDALRAARAAVDRILAAIPADGPMRHRLYPAPDPAVDPPLAADHVLAAWALLAAFEQSGEQRYLDGANALVQRAKDLFWDAEEGGFFDTVAEPAGFGYASRRLRLNDDSGYPALNALASRVLDRLWLHTGDKAHHEAAAACLKVVIGTAEKPDHKHSSLGLALEAHLRPSTRYVIVGPAGDPLAADLTRAAHKVFDPGKVVERLDGGSEAQKAVLAALGITADGVYVVACAGTKCSAPVRDVAAVSALSAPR